MGKKGLEHSIYISFFLLAFGAVVKKTGKGKWEQPN